MQNWPRSRRSARRNSTASSATRSNENFRSCLPHSSHWPARRERRRHDQRTPEQQQLIKEYPFLNVDRGSVYLYLPDRLNGFNKKWDDLTAETKKKRPADDYVMCLTEVAGQVPVTKLFARGRSSTASGGNRRGRTGRAEFDGPRHSGGRCRDSDNGPPSELRSASDRAGSIRWWHACSSIDSGCIISARDWF